MSHGVSAAAGTRACGSAVRRFALLVLFALGSTETGMATPRALVVSDLNAPQLALAGARIRAVLVARGFAVDLVAAPPADLSPYCCAWDIRNETPLTAAEEASYLGFLQAGHGLFLAGEHPGCCRERNGSIGRFLKIVAGGGLVRMDDPTDLPGSTVEQLNAAHVLSRSPNAVKEVTWDGNAAGVFLDHGNGLWLTARTALPRIVSAVWDEGTLTNAPEGRVVVTLDVNWLIETFAKTDNEAFLDNLAAFLCPQDASAFTIVLAVPGPFDLECPAPLALEGTVDGLLGDCAVSFRAIPRVVAVAASVDGGPAKPVASTTPTLPADVPVSFATGPLALDPGAHTIVVSAEDDLGNRAEASVSGMVRDTTAPVMDPATCQDVVVDLGPGCVLDYAGVPVATDLCDASVAITANPPLPVHFGGPGTVVITYEAKDDAGNKDACARQVTARDISGPILVCAAPVTVECTATGGSPATDPAIQAFLGATTASDNCALDTLTNDAPAIFASGCTPGQATAVTWTATDKSLNSSTCASDLSVVDGTAPSFSSTPGSLFLECSQPGGVPQSDPAIQAWLAQFQGSDICSATVASSDDAPSLFPAGCAPGKQTTVTYTLADDCGNEATASAIVSVLDSTPPVLSVPLPLTLECNGPGGVLRTDPAVQAWLALAAASDLCGAAGVTDDAPALLPSGCGAGTTTTVTFTATDGCGLVTTLTSTITVKDTTAPALSVPAPLTLECNGPGGISRSNPAIAAWLGAASATDVCGSATLSDDAPLLFPSGCGPGATTTVTFMAVDDCGNLATLSSTVTVRDTTAPALAVPAPLAIECNVAGGVPRSDPAVLGWLGSASASDLCDGAVIADNAPLLLPSGCAPGKTTTVTFTATDNCGNATPKDSTATVVDTTAPVLTAPAPITLECNGAGGIAKSDPSIAAWLASVTSSDVCGSQSVSNDAPLLFPSGCGAGIATTVTFTASDNCGNLTTRTSTVTVRDTTAPALSVPGALVLECNGAGGIPRTDLAIAAWLAFASGADVCDGATLANNAPAFFPSGCGAGTTTTVTFTATDNCGNATTRTATVTVRDTTAPTLNVPAAITLECNGPGGVAKNDPAIVAWLAAANGSDVCDGTTITHNAPALFPSGCGAGTTTVVTFSAVDNCGNLTVKTSSVTVRDTSAPVLNVPSAITLECNGRGGIPLSDPQVQAWLASASASDVCDGATLANDAPALFPSGCTPGTTTAVTFTAVDNCGNLTVKTSSVTVQDSTPPDIGPIAFDGICLWPPNHNFYCIEDVAKDVSASDVCDPNGPELLVISCVSSQPEEGNGDGNFEPDCVLLDGGRGVCVRAERDGSDPEGRVYTLEVGATDACGNRSTKQAEILVPHDRSSRDHCLRPLRLTKP